MIVVAGEALIDLVVSPGATTIRSALGGGPFNTARAAARLGANAAFLGVLSRDRFGTALAAALRADTVDVAMVQLSDMPTTLAIAELDDVGAATYRFYSAETASPALEVVPLPAATAILHVGTLGLVLDPMATAIEGLVRAVDESVIVMIDANCRPQAIGDRDAYIRRFWRIAERADVIKASVDDLGYLFGHEQDSGVQRMIDAGARLVLETDGGNAARVHGLGTPIEVPVPAVEVVDTIGAGDSFGGAFAAFWDLSLIHI